MYARPRSRDGVETGFSLVEVMIAMLVLVTVMFSLTYVLVNSLADTAYARQRSQATNLANQIIEQVRALPWSTIEQGMSATDILTSGDANVTGNCFEGSPLDLSTGILGAGAVGSQSCTAGTSAWQDPSCLSQAVSSLPAPPQPPVSSGMVPAPISPHQACYQVGTLAYAVDVYITGTSGSVYPASSLPLTATVVVTWAHALRHGLSDHVVTTTELSNCTKGNAQC